MYTLLGICSSAAERTILQDFAEELALAPDNQGKIVVMQLDVTHDGRPEFFIGALPLAGPYGLDWGVYSPQGDGTYRRLGFITFQYESFYYLQAESLFSVRMGATRGRFTRYHVGAEGFSELSEQPNDAVEAKRVSEWKLKARPRLYSAAVLDIRGGQPVVWRDAATNTVGPDLGHLDGMLIE